MATLDLPASVAREAADFVLHPSVTDGLFQAAAMLVCDPSAPPSAPILPFALEALRVHGACVGPMQAWVRFADGQALRRTRAIDIDLFDAEGHVCVEIRGYLPRHSGAARSEALLANRVWTPRDAHATTPCRDRRRVLVWALPDIASERIAEDCVAIAPRDDDDLAGRYATCARAAFEALQSLLAERSTLGGLLQVVVPDSEADALCIGIAGLLTVLVAGDRSGAWGFLVPSVYLPVHLIIGIGRAVMNGAPMRTDPPPTAMILPLMMIVAAAVGAAIAAALVQRQASR